MTGARTLAELRAQILDLAGEYCTEAFQRRPFVPGETPIPVSGKVFDDAEMRLLVDASLDFWLTTGRYADQFEREFARWWGIRECVLTNSGSSANLLALSALTSPKLGDRRLVPGDEVITVAAGFPTTGQSDPAKPPDAGLHRRDRAHLQRRCEPARSRAFPAYTRHHHRPHPGQSLRPGCRHGLRPAPLPMVHRRLLRRRRLCMARPQSRHCSATSPPPASTLPTTSPWARAAAS